MPNPFKTVAHEDELSVVDHLNELRWRLVSTIIVFCAVWAVCFWQNHAILEFVNTPLPDGITPATFGVSEAFMSTVTVVSYAALLITLPFVLYNLYAYVLPGLRPPERKVAMPLLLLAPVLFVAGVAFGYYVVLPAAIHFLLNFNNDQFNNQVRAKDYYSFFGMTLLAMGLLFEIPIGVLIANRLGFVNHAQLRRRRREAWIVIAILAMLLPGTDPVTMLVEMVPMLLLYELSVGLVWYLDRRDAGARARTDTGPESMPAQ